MEAMGGKAKFYAFFQSDCAVRTDREVRAEDYMLVVKNEAKQKRRLAASTSLSPREMTLRTIITKSLVAELTLADNTRLVATLEVLVAAGLRRT